MNEMLYFGDMFEGQSNNASQVAQGVKVNAKNAKESNPSAIDAPTQQNVMGAWLFVAGVLVALTLLLQRLSPEQTFSHVKIGFYNMIVIGFYAVLFIAIGKVFASKTKDVRGLGAISTLFLSV